jgi:hypothetical protein
MKITMWIAGSLTAAALICSGCGKPKQSPQAPAAQPVPVNVPKLRDACASGSAGVQSGANRAIMAIRMANWAAALAELDRLAANPSLTEPQKQAVSEVREQVKHNLAQSPAGPSQ